MSIALTPFLMFQGEAGAALDLYTRALPGATVAEIARYGPDGPGRHGTVERAVLRIGSQRILCIDSPVAHDFSFTPAVSLHVGCDEPHEADAIFAALAEGGEVLMPLDAHPFSRRFGWLNDRFGVSWKIGTA